MSVQRLWTVVGGGHCGGLLLSAAAAVAWMDGWMDWVTRDGDNGVDCCSGEIDAGED